MVFLSAHNGTSNDEAANISASVSIWKYGGCFELYPVNPPLTKLIASIPLLFCKYDIDWQIFDNYLEYHEAGVRPEFSVAYSMVERNADKIQFYLFISRLFCIPFAVLGGYFCWRWSSELYGKRAGLCAVVLWCSSPEVLTWGAYVMPDMAAASCGLMFGYLFWYWIKKTKWANVWGVSMALGLALLTKFTWLILFPLLPLLWLCGYYSNTINRTWSVLFNQFMQLIMIVVVGIFVLNLGYGFERFGTRLGDFQFASKILTGKNSIADEKNNNNGNRFADTVVANIPIPLPANYVIGIDLQKVDFEKGLPSYLNGKWSDHGWWYFYLECVLLKFPLGTLGLMLLAISFGLTGVIRKRSKFHLLDELILLTPAILIFIFVSSQTGFSRHFRYILPAIPFIFIFTSRTIAIAFDSCYFWRLTVCVLLLSSIVAVLAVFPHTMSFFNSIAGGPHNGYKYLIDSNIDWGQDVFRFKKWLKQYEAKVRGIHIKMRDRIADVFFMEDNYPDVPYSPVKVNGNSERDCSGPLPGWFAISVQQIMERQERYRYFLELKPKYTIGYSIRVYHISFEQANVLRKKYELPEIEKPTDDIIDFGNNLVKRMNRDKNTKIAVYSVPDEKVTDLNLKRILDNEPSFSWQPINAQQIINGELKFYDVIIFPGGKGTKQWETLGKEGRKKVDEFVRNGSGYLGICAGAFLATTRDHGLSLINARAVSGKRYVANHGTISSIGFYGVGNVDRLGR
ncbi:MAG: glycosyltransferase family 39 protein [Planctomycetaceae bacterium]|nr:glycosyltransferase family 39 protein [Planctomycetaceae bacterium]